MSIYNYYLSTYKTIPNEVDSFTNMVAIHVKQLTHFFGWESDLLPHEKEASVKMMFNGKYVSRMVEGCNAVSVMILFASFIFAFSNGLKKTTLYIILGITGIYTLNILRITLLNYALFYHPNYKELLHDIIFPLFIYGIVFLLWVYWVTKYSTYAKK